MRGERDKALNEISVIHYQRGREDESRAAARALVEEHFDDAPPDAAAVVVEGARGWRKC